MCRRFSHINVANNNMLQVSAEVCPHLSKMPEISAAPGVAEAPLNSGVSMQWKWSSPGMPKRWNEGPPGAPWMQCCCNWPKFPAQHRFMKRKISAPTKTPAPLNMYDRVGSCAIWPTRYPVKSSSLDRSAISGQQGLLASDRVFW